MSDHAVDLHLAAITAAPTRRPGLAGDPVAGGLLETFANLDQGGPARAAARGRAPPRPSRAAGAGAAAAGRADDDRTAHRAGRDRPGARPRQGDPATAAVPVARSSTSRRRSQVLLDDPEADLRVTRQLDGLVGQDLSGEPAAADDRRRPRDAPRTTSGPEQPQQAATPGAGPERAADAAARPAGARLPRRVASFGSTPALLRRLGLAVDVVLDGVDAAGARAALAGATWVSVTITSPAADLRGAAAAADVGRGRRRRCSRRGRASAWVGGALPLGDDEWVVLDVDPDASGLKLDQHPATSPASTRARPTATRRRRRPARCARPGFALARRDRAAQLRGRVQEAEQLAADDGTRELLLDDLVRGIRVEVWDDATKEWHSLHRRRVTVTGEGSPAGAACWRTCPTSGSCSCRRSTGRRVTRRTATTCTRSSPAGTAGACPRRGPA